MCRLNLMAWNASLAPSTGENEKNNKKDNDKIKRSVQTSSACASKRRHYVQTCNDEKESTRYLSELGFYHISY